MKKLLITTTIASLCAMPLLGQAATYKEVSVSNGGTITGSVKFTGKKDAPPKPYSVLKNNEVCGTEKRHIDFMRVKDGHLLDTVVYLVKIKEGKPFPPNIGNGTVVQEGCEFSPFLGVMRNKTKLSAINKDPVLHNIHTYEILSPRTKKGNINVSQPDQNTITKTIKLKKGTAMKVECDAHDFMHAYIFVAKNPYFAIVKEDGSYSIDNIPAGKYTVKAWHNSSMKWPKSKVVVTSGGTTTIDLTFKNTTDYFK